MDCTGESKRIRICRDYDIEVVGCYKLFGGRSVRSDAGGKIITDKYYFFKCIHKTSHREEHIRCGNGAANHICRLIGVSMPTEFNPFFEPHLGGGDGGGGVVHHHWHRTRRQLHNAIMLFVTRYGTVLQPDSPIFEIKARVEQNIEEPVRECDVLAVNTILGAFHTTMSNILNEFARTRTVRNFHFDTLEQILINRGLTTNNYS